MVVLVPPASPGAQYTWTRKRRSVVTVTECPPRQLISAPMCLGQKARTKRRVPCPPVTNTDE